MRKKKKKKINFLMSRYFSSHIYESKHTPRGTWRGKKNLRLNNIYLCNVESWGQVPQSIRTLGILFLFGITIFVEEWEAREHRAHTSSTVLLSTIEMFKRTSLKFFYSTGHRRATCGVNIKYQFFFLSFSRFVLKLTIIRRQYLS